MVRNVGRHVSVLGFIVFVFCALTLHAQQEPGLSDEKVEKKSIEWELPWQEGMSKDVFLELFENNLDFIADNYNALDWQQAVLHMQGGDIDTTSAKELVLNLKTAQDMFVLSWLIYRKDTELENTVNPFIKIYKQWVLKLQETLLLTQSNGQNGIRNKAFENIIFWMACKQLPNLNIFNESDSEIMLDNSAQNTAYFKHLLQWLDFKQLNSWQIIQFNVLQIQAINNLFYKVYECSKILKTKRIWKTRYGK